MSNNNSYVFLSTIFVFTIQAFFMSQVASIPMGIEIYEVQEFIADFSKFKIGDIIPEKYKDQEYTIKQWRLRNLPMPGIGTHWIYMGENYVLVDDTSGRIHKAYNGDIFYHH